MVHTENPPYITVGFGLAGWYAVLRMWYEDIQGYDNWGTGIGHYPTREQAIEEAEEWAMAENIKVII